MASTPDADDAAPPQVTPVWREVARAVADMGATRCFGLVGGANFKVTHALAEFGVAFVAARHEGGAVTMADACARLSGELTVASVTAGPGLTNALTGIAEAAKSDTPLLVIAGDVATGDVRSSFSIGQAAMVGATGAAWVQIADPDRAYERTVRAVAQVLHGRQTVVLSLPVDVQEARVVAATSLNRAMMVAWRDASSAPSLHPADIDDVVTAIRASRRPLILAGRGAVVAGAERDLLVLGDRIGALLATTVQAHGLFAGHAWTLGICGGFSSPAAADLIVQSDLVLAFGASLNGWTTKRGYLIAAATRVIQIDAVRERLGIHRPVYRGLQSDAAAAAKALHAALGETKPIDTGWRTAATADIIASRSNCRAPYAETSTATYLDPRTFTRAMDGILPRNRVVVSDGGHFVGWAPRYLSVPDPAGWCIPIAFQSIGLGLAAAIGAGVAQPQRAIVLATGDGGLLMALAELETAVRLQLRICILIYNDSAYSAEVHHFATEFSPRMAQFPTTDFARLARGIGADGVIVRTLDDMEPVVRWVAGGGASVFVVDARIDPTLQADWYRDAFSKPNEL